MYWNSLHSVCEYFSRLYSSMWIYYVVAFIEWFSTLAVEILALRIAAPITWSSSIVTSVFLGIILLALSAGYWVGGIISSKMKHRRIVSFLWYCLLFSGAYYVLISFGYETVFLKRGLDRFGYTTSLFFTSLLLFFVPVFIASQTIPLLTELLDDKSKWKAAGKMLFASTVGSFFGSVGTSIVLFQSLGVTTTAIVVSLSLWWATILLRWRHRRLRSLLVVLFGVFLFFFVWMARKQPSDSIIYAFDSAYQQIVIKDVSTEKFNYRLFSMNGENSSAISVSTKHSPFRYIQEVAKQTKRLQPKRILVIGTAGFSYPYEVSELDFVEQIDAVDIDPSVKHIAEKYFLEEQLSQKINFIPQSARYFVHEALEQWKIYDLIFVDAYHGKSLPAELTTLEFFQDLDTLVGSGVVMFNMIWDREHTSALAKNISSTLLTAFWDMRYLHVTRNKREIENIIIANEQLRDDYTMLVWDGEIYTDDMRSTEADTIELYRGKGVER